MLLKIIPRDDETGVLDGEFRDGDIMAVYLDSAEPTLGSLEKKTSLFVKIPDPPNLTAFMDQLVEPEYAPGPTPGSPNVVRRKRKFRVDWRSKFTEAEIDLIESAADTLPDGSTTSGGVVTAGVVAGLFTAADVIRK